MIADMISNTKLHKIVTELFTKGRKSNISFVFITQSYLKVLKESRLSTTHIFIMASSNKESFSKFQYIINQILNLKILWRHIKNILQKSIPFELDQMIHHILEKSFRVKIE